MKEKNMCTITNNCSKKSLSSFFSLRLERVRRKKLTCNKIPSEIAFNVIIMFRKNVFEINYLFIFFVCANGLLHLKQKSKNPLAVLLRLFCYG